MRLNRAVAIAILLGLFCLAGLCAFVVLFTGGEDFYGCTFNLSSDKNVYLPGDNINLTLTIIPRHSKTVHLYRRMEYNILVRPLVWSNYSKRRHESKQQIDVFDLRPDRPLRLQIQGHVMATNSTNKIFIDFGGFGQVEVPAYSEIAFSAKPYPAKVSSTDSEDWGCSNVLPLRFAFLR